MFLYTRRAHIVLNDGKKEEEERIELLNKALNDYNNYYIVNRIYFSKDIVEKLNNLSTQYYNSGIDFSLSKLDIKNREFSGEYFKENLKKIQTISDNVEIILTPLIDKVENKFRVILGAE